jgi:hypothetical protein
MVGGHLDRAHAVGFGAESLLVCHFATSRDARGAPPAHRDSGESL